MAYLPHSFGMYITQIVLLIQAKFAVWESWHYFQNGISLTKCGCFRLLIMGIGFLKLDVAQRQCRISGCEKVGLDCPWKKLSG